MNKLRRNESGFSAVEVILVLIILVLLGAVGYLVYKNHQKPGTATPTTATSNKPAASTSKSSTQPADPTADWTTYTSSVGGFSLKYPGSGWTLTAYHNSSDSWVSGSLVTSTDRSLAINENTGQGSSTDKLQYGITINIDTSSSGASQENASVTYGLGDVVQTLGNGIELWQTSEKTFGSGGVPACGNNGIVELAAANGGNLYLKLPNGQYLTYSASFCQGPGQTLTQSYQQQVNDSEMTVAKEILGSLTYK